MTLISDNVLKEAYNKPNGGHLGSLRAVADMVESIVKNNAQELCAQAAAIQKAKSTMPIPEANGCKCVVCFEWQYWTPSGMVCKNGHGGVKGINTQLYTVPPIPKNVMPEQILTADPNTLVLIGEVFDVMDDGVIKHLKLNYGDKVFVQVESEAKQ